MGIEINGTGGIVLLRSWRQQIFEQMGFEDLEILLAVCYYTLFFMGLESI